MSAVQCTHLDQIAVTDAARTRSRAARSASRSAAAGCTYACARPAARSAAATRLRTGTRASMQPRRPPDRALRRAGRGLELVLRRRGRVRHRLRACCGIRRRSRLSVAPDKAIEEGERRLGDFLPAAVDRERVAAARHLDDLGHALVALLLLERRVRDRPGDGVVLLAGDDQSGPRSGFFESTFTSVHGLKFAVAAWNSGAPAAGTA